MELRFPADRIVGILEWVGSWDEVRGPIMASGTVRVPDDVEVSLRVTSVTGGRVTRAGKWQLQGGDPRCDLGFLLDLPSDSITALSIHEACEESIGAIAHLALGLKKLYLSATDFHDEAINALVDLNQLRYLQTYGNKFTNNGVQLLGNVKGLEYLYLEERTLDIDAFSFIRYLPRLKLLGVRGARLSEEDVQRISAMRPDVEVDR